MEQFLDEDGRLTLFTGETKTQADLDRVIGLGKPQRVIDLFRAMVNMTNQWVWCMDYIYYLNDKYDYDNWQPESYYNEEGELVETLLVDTVAPIEPTQPIDISDTYSRTLFKADRTTKVANLTVEEDGLVFDGDEDSQNRIVRAITVLVGEEEMPWTLANNEVVMVNQTTLRKVLVKAGYAQSAIWQQ